MPSFCYTILQYKQKGTECLKRHQIACFHGSVAPPLTECSFNIYDKVFFVQTTGSLLQDTYCEEMYNLDNDSFLNSLENVVIPPHSSLSIRTCSTNSNSRGTPSSAGSTDQSISILSNSSTQSHRGIMSRFDSEAWGLLTTVVLTIYGCESIKVFSSFCLVGRHLSSPRSTVLPLSLEDAWKVLLELICMSFNAHCSCIT